MNREQQQLRELALGAISADCARASDGADSEKTREATQLGPIELSDGTCCFLVSVDNCNIVVHKTPLTASQKTEAEFLATKRTGILRTCFRYFPNK